MLLLANSPAIDKGHRFIVTTDQRGLPRPLDIAAYPNAAGGDGSDIGALEVDPPQAGPTFIVTITLDFDDGLCGVADCTLREAINAANAAPGGNTISFAPGITGTIQLGSVLPSVSGNLAVQGPGANLLTVRRNTGADYRIFTITNGTSIGPVVSLAGLTINNGKAPAPASLNGGGILNDHGDLTLTNCVVSGNVATNGAGIHTDGTTSGNAKLTLTGCTLNNNVASGFGGAINNNGSHGGNAITSLTNCTLHGNDANRGAAVWTSGAAGSANLSVFNCTIADNSAPFAGIYNDGTSGSGIVTLRSTILKTGASGANIANVNNAGTVTSQDYNLSNDSGSGFLIGDVDQINTDPLLAPLTDNGGPTPTRLLLPGSAALDKGKSFGLLIDQRGLARVADTVHTANAARGDGTDIGAAEMNPFGGSLVDADADGMPDEFEVFYGVMDPNGDADGDGDGNLREYLNGTNPRNNSSFVLRIIAIVRNGSDIVITFNGVAGKTFRLERKDALTDTSWSNIAGVADVTPPTTGNAQHTHPSGALAPRAFYRVRLLP
jgi:CSLREA domain-containing protein